MAARCEVAGAAHHHHLVDLDSGAVLEFTSGALEAAIARVAGDPGYALVGHRLELSGRRRPVPADEG